MIDNREDNNYCLVRASHLDVSEKEETQQQQQQIIPKEKKNLKTRTTRTKLLSQLHSPSSEVFHHCQEKRNKIR